MKEENFTKKLEFYNKLQSGSYVDKKGLNNNYIFYSKYPEIDDKGNLLYRVATYNKGRNHVKNVLWELTKTMKGKRKTNYKKIKKEYEKHFNAQQEMVNDVSEGESDEQD